MTTETTWPTRKNQSAMFDTVLVALRDGYLSFINEFVKYQIIQKREGKSSDFYSFSMIDFIRGITNLGCVKQWAG